jgi:RNA polymerase sigma factor (sigma-70 family)
LVFHSGAATAISRALLTPEQQTELIERIRRREPSAEEELVHLFWNRILFLALSRTHDPEASRDLAQDVMLAVVRALRSDQLRDSERLAAFVYGIARNLINSHLRARSRLPTEHPIDAAFDVASPPVVDNSERVSLVRRALGVLDSTDRRILMLTLVEDLKPGEIAIRLGLTSEVVRTRKSRALKKIIERIKKLSRT